MKINACHALVAECKDSLSLFELLIVQGYSKRCVSNTFAKSFIFLNTLRLFFTLLIPFLVTQATAQDVITEELDLKGNWKSFRNGQFESYQNSGVRYFTLDDAAMKGANLLVAGEYPIAIFLNHKLIAQIEKPTSFSMDSLSRMYAAPMLFGIYSQGALSTKLIRSRTTDVWLVPRTLDAFENFVILTGIILIIFITSLLYVNPKLTFDYFNVIKFLSIQEREETLTATRTGTSINFVYYFFCSLLIAFLLMVLARQSSITYKFEWAQPASLLIYFWNLVQLALIVFFIVLSKLVGVTAMAHLFNVREIASFQFFNSVRVFLIASALVSLISILFFMIGLGSGDSYFWILKFGFAVVVFSTVLLFFKLLPKVPFRFSHLFSYLCASEIIPLVILIKVLFK